MTLETKHGVFYFRAFSHLEVLPGCLKRMSVIGEGFGDSARVSTTCGKRFTKAGIKGGGQTRGCVLERCRRWAQD
jgi:hypothetical protein